MELIRKFPISLVIQVGVIQKAYVHMTMATDELLHLKLCAKTPHLENTTVRTETKRKTNN